MVQAALGRGTAHRRSVFELFPRRLPEGRRYGVVAGVGRALDAIEEFTFDDEALATLEGVVNDETREWLASYRFSGDVWGYAEGEAYFPYSPLLIVEGTFAEAVVLETLLLSIYNHDSAIASAASRMTMAAGDRPCIEMGSRRTHEEAAVASARAAYLAGFASTSNLAARQRYGVPSAGTSAHSFTLLHDSEADAFRAQVTSLGKGTTLLVDTYDVQRGRARRRRDRRAGAGCGPPRLRRPRRAGPPGPQAARRPRRDEDPDRGDQRPRRVRHRRARRRPRRRLRRRHPAGHRQRPPDLRLRLQARRPRGRRRRDGLGREEERRQDLHRRPQVRAAPARRAGRGRGRGGRHRHPARERRQRPSAPRRAGPRRRGRRAASRSPTRGPGTPPSRAELPWSVQQMSKGEPVIPTIHLEGHLEG